jgi:hypothetical protein
VDRIAVRTNAERELAYVKRKEKESMFIEVIAKALYIPNTEEPLYLHFERRDIHLDGRFQEVAVVRKAHSDQNNVCIGNDIETIRQFGKMFFAGDCGFTLNELLYVFEGRDTRDNVLVFLPMRKIEEMENDKMLIIDRENLKLKQNPELTAGEYDAFLTRLRMKGNLYHTVRLKISNDFPELRK